MGKLRDEILTIWQQAANSSDEPDNEQLARWVGTLVRLNEDQHRRSKDDFQRIDRLRKEVARAYALPTPQSLVTEAAVGHLDMALMDLKSARRRVIGDYVNPERQLPSLPPLDDGIARIRDAKNLLTGQPVEACPGGCGIGLAHPGNPDRQCACPKLAPRVWEQIEGAPDDIADVIEVGGDRYRVAVRRQSGQTTFVHEDEHGATGHVTFTLGHLRELGDVREVPS